METHDIVVIGASAGGIEALSSIVKELPLGFAASIFVVVHISPDSPGYLPEILANRGRLPAKNAEDGERFARGHIYVAPPDRHLLVEANGMVRTSRGPRENRSRPAVDPLFRSAALAFGPRVVGVVLSGGLDDGTAGLRAIKMCGGVSIVQDPSDSLADSMPLTALRNVTIDYCKPSDELGQLLASIIVSPVQESEPSLEQDMEKQLNFEVEVAKAQKHSMAVTKFGLPSPFTCPECHGTLMRLQGERPPRFRCHTGHAYTADSLLADLGEATDHAIWNSIRSLQETAMLLTHLADHWRGVDSVVAQRFSVNAKVEQARADEMRVLAIKKSDQHGS